MNPDHDRSHSGAAKVFLDHADLIRKVISFRVQDEDEASDLFQDFFLCLICNPLPRDVRNIESYLYRMLTNHVNHVLHRREEYSVRLREYTGRAWRPVSGKTPQESVLEAEELSAVFEIIENRLPRAEAKAVRLRYADNLNAKEIADKMGVRTGTVRRYVSEGLSRIRTLVPANET